MEGILLRLRKNKVLSFVYVANLLISFHYYIVVYLNSSFLGTYFSDQTVSILFMVGSIGSLILFFQAPRMVRALGVYTYITVMTMIECAVVFGLAFSTTALSILCLFLIYNTVLPTIIFALDIFLETATQGETHTGRVRSIYMTISNATLVLSPLLMGFILKSYSFRYAYFISALFCIPLLIVCYSYFQKVNPASPLRVDMKSILKRSWKDPDIRYVIVAHFILQFFYFWMIVYLPIYLIKTIGFSWTQIGTLFTIMLLPFIIFEIPVGLIADKKLGEKELMIFGFVLTACAAASFALPTKPDFMLWAILLFMSRVGASFIEITVESYFFKHVKGEDSDLISVFRMATEVAYIVAPAIAIFTLAKFSFAQNFWILGCVVFLGSIVALQIKDTL